MGTLPCLNPAKVFEDRETPGQWRVEWSGDDGDKAVCSGYGLASFPHRSSSTARSIYDDSSRRISIFSPSEDTNRTGLLCRRLMWGGPCSANAPLACSSVS